MAQLPTSEKAEGCLVYPCNPSPLFRMEKKKKKKKKKKKPHFHESLFKINEKFCGWRSRSTVPLSLLVVFKEANILSQRMFLAVNLGCDWLDRARLSGGFVSW